MWKYAAIRAGLEGCWWTGAHHAARPVLGGRGVILTAHRVTPEPPAAFAPNRILTITPDYLDTVVERVRAHGFDIVDLDEAVRRLADHDAGRFVVLTFDDGYRDNVEFAWPVLRRHAAPFTVYVPSAFPSGEGVLWWLALEEIIARADRLEWPGSSGVETWDVCSLAAKEAAWAKAYVMLRDAGEGRRRDMMADLAVRHGFDSAQHCRDLILDWESLGHLARDPLVSIGAHGIDHAALAQLPSDEALAQMVGSARAIERELGRPVRHFSFPYGLPWAAGPRDFALARDAGFATAVTTRPGLLYPEHVEHLTALPRVSLNGAYQSVRYLDVLLSGLPSYVLNGFDRLNVA